MSKFSKLSEKFRPAGYGGNMKVLFSKLLKIGIINTIRFNYHYFGFSKIFRPVFLLSRSVDLRCMQGNIIIDTQYGVGLVTLGLNSNGMVPGGGCSWENTGSIIIKGSCHFGPGTKIVNTGRLTLGGKGDPLRFNGNGALLCYHQIDIGACTVISWDVQIMDTDLHNIYNQADNTLINKNRPVYIGEHCWIGCRCLILKGANIPNNSIIAAGSVVTKSLSASNAVYVSNTSIKQNVMWK